MSRPDRARSCWGKATHATRKGAATEAARLRRVTGDNIRPYRCGHCGSYHAGHPIGTSADRYHQLHGQVA